MKVLFTRRAERQVRRLHAYIAQRSGEKRADAYIDRIVLFCLRLQTFPQRGRRRDDLLSGLRVIGFERRIAVAFVITDDAVLIEGIYYGGRDVNNLRSRT